MGIYMIMFPRTRASRPWIFRINRLSVAKGGSGDLSMAVVFYGSGMDGLHRTAFIY